MIDLSKNENPTPASSQLLQAIFENAENLNRYPVSLGEDAHAAAANCFGVDRDQIALTRGIDGALDALIALYRERTFVVVAPGFNGFVERLRANNLVPEVMALNQDFQLPDTEIRHLDRNSFVLLASPNNPTGRRFSNHELELVQSQCHGMLIDQTYEDFATCDVAVPPLRENSYRFRSFSKGFGLAGLRIGALIGSSEDIARITGREQFCYIDTLACQAIIAVANKTAFQDQVATIRQQCEKLANGLKALGFNVLTGEGNFVLVRHGEAKRMCQHLSQSGILIKDTEAFGLRGHVRISAGTDQDHEALFEALSLYKASLAHDVNEPMLGNN